MRCLLIDNSNTRTKFAIGTKEKIEPLKSNLNTPEITPESLQQSLTNIQFDSVYLCSVVPIKAELIKAHFSTLPFHQLNHLSNLGIKIDYPNPEQIGADRLANVVGVHHLFSSPAIVIDFGTAVTFDVIGPDATYLGGVIAPGLPSMTDYLSNRTALLPKIQLTEPQSAIGKSTSAAMNAGAVYGYRGLVREIISNLRREMNTKPAIIATGGDAPLIAQKLSEIEYVSQTLTLEGIRIAAKKQFNF